MDDNTLLKELSEKGLKNLKKKRKEKSSILNHRYILGEKIGEGGLSSVYQASDVYCQFFKDNRNIVVKIPSDELSVKLDIEAFIYSEYSILVELKHENIVRVLDFGIDDDKHLPYIVMEKLDGDLLSNISLHKLTKEMKMNIAMSLSSALSYIHKKDIVHADINPTNIMVSSSGNVNIFDFGISKNLVTDKNFSLSYKKANAYNPIYSAPEIHGGKSPSKKTDLFSLACVLYELYTNELPFKKSSIELKKKNLSKQQLSKIPLLQRAWFKKALQHRPEKRISKMPFCIRTKHLLKNYFE